MKKASAAQQRLFQNASFIAATRLLFDKLAEQYTPKTLSEVITIFNGQSLKKSERQDDGIFDVYGSGGMVGNYSEFLSENPFVVIGRKGSAGKPTYAPFGGWVIDTAYYAQPNDLEALNTKFLYYALSSLDFSDDIISTAIPGINRTAIYKHLIPVPPVDMQIAVSDFLDAAKSKTTLPTLPDELADIHRIVERIEALAGRVDEARSLRREAGDLVEKLFASAISQVIKPFGDNLKKLDDICLVVTDGEHATPPRDSAGDIPLATAKNARDGYLDLGNTDFVTAEVAEKCWKRCKPLENDVLMVCVGATTGRVCRLINPPEMVIVRSVALLRPNPEILDSHYLEYALESSACQTQIWNLVKRAAQPGIYINRMKQILVPIIPLEEQRRLVAYLDGLQAQVAKVCGLQEESARELEAMMPSILDKAFKGEL
jgi:hypothetical protein